MQQEKQGVLLVNLGTPDTPTSSAVKRYLKAFLSDRRVVDTSPLLWWLILNSVILPWRAPRIAKLYKSIWMEDGSPLLVHSYRQQKALAIRIPDIVVELGMNYGTPSLATALNNLLTKNITNLVILPLYPQYSSSTSAAVWDEIARVLKNYRRLPSIKFIRDYATHPAYIFALQQKVEHSFAKYGFPDRLILSFHGISKRCARLGDDYPQRCKDTKHALTAALSLPTEQVIMTYQSRFGYEPWLMPFTNETLKNLPIQGVNHVQLICPGFSVDCLETLEEIKEQNSKIFLKAGGQKFKYISALNDEPAHIDMMRQLVMKYI
ncbi:ferrochelatase [Serratia symbiotica str. 'Cinara cedri']|nr:ferrochelatase [Serratia symbiotica str. 'Cinara cedri']